MVIVIVCSEPIIRVMQKEGKVFIYYKETLELKMILVSDINESLLCEVTIGSKKCITGTVYKSPSQNLMT